MKYRGYVIRYDFYDHAHDKFVVDDIYGPRRFETLKEAKNFIDEIICIGTMTIGTK